MTGPATIGPSIVGLECLNLLRPAGSTVTFHTYQLAICFNSTYHKFRTYHAMKYKAVLISIIIYPQGILKHALTPTGGR